MVQMVMNAVGFQSGAKVSATARVAQPMRTPMLFQKAIGFAVISSSYVAIVAGLVHLINR
jgi:hypothetical protein